MEGINLNNAKETNDFKIMVHTFGIFDIVYNKKSIVAPFYRSNKLYELFKYFIAHKDSKLSSIMIIDDLWLKDDYNDSRNILKTQIFRLRKILEQISSMCDDKNPFKIQFVGGNYFLEISDNCILDTDVFNSGIKDLDNISSDDIDKSINIYDSILKVYKGEYFKDSVDNLWIVPMRNYYKRIYLNSVRKVIQLLKTNNDYEKIVNICEEAVNADPFEEELHIYFMDALLQTNRSKEAMEHYRYITSKFYNEIGIRPSLEMTNIYIKIRNNNFMEKASLLDKDLNKTKPIICSKENFQHLYNVERERAIDNNLYCTLLTIKINTREKSKNGKVLLEQRTEDIKELLINSLRKGDLISVINVGYIAAILRDVDAVNHNIVIKRINKKIEESLGFEVKIKIEPILSHK